MRRSLIKNELLSDIREHKLLSRLAGDLESTRNNKNVEVGASILGNILLDDLSL